MSKRYLTILALFMLIPAISAAQENSESMTLSNYIEGNVDNINPFEIRLPEKAVEETPPSPLPPPTRVRAEEPFRESGFRDPAPVAVPTGMDITGLIFKSHRPQAIIGGEIYDIGDTINDMKIVDIRKDGVELIRSIDGLEEKIHIKP